MILLYTGAKTFNSLQNSYLKSLGGFISASKVPNNSLGNVFSNISTLGMERGYKETRAVVLKNTTGGTVTNVYLYHTYPLADVKAKIEWAFVTIPNTQSMEEINSSEDDPYSITSFVEPIGVGGKVLIATSLANNAVLGLWVRRTIVTPNPVNAITATSLETYLAALTKAESIPVTIEYTP